MGKPPKRNFEQFVRLFGASLRLDQCPLRSGVVGGGLATAGLPVGPSALPRKFIRLEVGEADYLFTLAARAKRGLLEIGRLYGGSAFLLAWANPSLPVYSIDIAPEDDASLARYCAAHDVTNLRTFTGPSAAEWPEIAPGSYDLVFIDGDHSYTGCLADLERWAPGLAPGGHVVLHDGHKRQVAGAIESFLDKNASFQAIRGPYLASQCLDHEWAGSMAHLRMRPPG